MAKNNISASRSRMKLIPEIALPSFADFEGSLSIKKLKKRMKIETSFHDSIK
jgi:hypothetical protein